MVVKTIRDFGHSSLNCFTIKPVKLSVTAERETGLAFICLHLFFWPSHHFYMPLCFFILTLFSFGFVFLFHVFLFSLFYFYTFTPTFINLLFNFSPVVDCIFLRHLFLFLALCFLIVSFSFPIMKFGFHFSNSINFAYTVKCAEWRRDQDTLTMSGCKIVSSKSVFVNVFVRADTKTNQIKCKIVRK